MTDSLDFISIEYSWCFIWITLFLHTFGYYIILLLYAARKSEVSAEVGTK